MYKIGTRGSLLAVTQCTLVKNLLESLSGEKFELHLIKTQGDQIVDKPLWQLEGKDFFTKELDEALLNGTVDMVVHSYKDLGSDRPSGIKLAAITERKYAHDILLIHSDTIKKLSQWSGDFVVGTSSPRRIVNLTRDLPAFIPHHPKIKCEMLRGNINTRIQKLRDGKYHAITLALAGLDRLAGLESSYVELSKLLKDLNFAILPLSIFPTAAAQGALAIECLEKRVDNGVLENILKKVHHLSTEEEVKREREAFKSYGGGCHLAVGIHVRKIDGDFLHFHRGETDGKNIHVKKREGLNTPFTSVGRVFLGQGENSKAICDDLYLKESTQKIAPTKGKHLFVTTTHVLDSIADAPTSLWAAGAMTRKKLVAKGFWVHGGADSLGNQELIKLSESKALKLMMGEAPWLVLSHDKATSPIGEVFAGYKTSMKEPSLEQKNALKKVTHAWWSSFPQYLAYTEKIPSLKAAQHFCGLGKTWSSFKENNISVTALTDQNEFLSLAGIQ
ncbi:MAG: hydroxymethylbilane synthase [Bacteriovoracaceae bacterium]|nr:hydroxymethylbilane synthase [Bacteriovoracaceae bacterium]